MEVCGRSRGIMNLSPESSIVVVEASGPVRQLIVSLLKAREYNKTQGVASIKDAISMMEVEKVDWVITSLCRDKEINGFQLLALVTAEEELKDVRISFFIDDSEMDMIPYAFEKGLFCFFNKKLNKDSFTKELDVLHEKLTAYAKDEVKVAGYFLASYLETAGLNQSNIALQKSLLDLYPGESIFFLSLAKAYHKAGDLDQAKQCFIQYHFLEGTFPEDIAGIVKELEIDVEKLAQGGAGGVPDIKALPLDSCAMVLKDEVKRKEIKDLLLALGVAEVNEFDSGEGAWLALENGKEPKLFILDWDAPVIPGPILVQKLKHLFPSMPCVVVSDKFDASDRELLKEMGVIAVLKISAKRREIIETLVYSVRQSKYPSEIATLEQKIRLNLANGNTQEALALKQKFDKLDNVSPGKKKLVEADFAFHDGNLTKARDLAIEVVKLDFDSVYVLNLLGKCFLKLGDLKSSLRCFSKAQEISPKNIERLCEIAVVNQNLKEEGASQKAIDEAKKLDEDSEKVKETEAGIDIIKGNAEEAKKIMAQLHSVQNVISFMNNQAVALAKAGQAEESIKLYQQTLESIPENKVSLKAIVLFNLGFAYLRQDNLEQCIATMEQVCSLENEKLKRKAQHLLDQIKSARESGKSFKFSGSADGDKKPETVEEDRGGQLQKESIVHTIGFRPGEYCCLKVFINPENPSAQISGLVSSIPRFSHRENIQRAVSGGLEKDMKT